MTNGVVISLLEEALARSMAITHGLNRDGRHVLWQPKAARQETAYATLCDVHEAAVLRLRRYAGKMYLVIKPTVKGTDDSGGELPADLEKELKRKVLTRQWNKEFAKALNVWQRLLLPSALTVYELPPNAASTFGFTVRKATTLAKICAPQPRYPANVRPEYLSLCAFEGTQYEEPKLCFSNRRGDGFVTDQPYDYALTARELVKQVRLGVVCPVPDAVRLFRYLSCLHQSWKPIQRQDYLLEYPGFGQAFGIPIGLPAPQDSA